MKKVVLELEKALIEQDVARTTAYTGAKNSCDGDSGSVYDRVATVNEDGELIARFVRDACFTVVEHLKEFVTGVNYSGDMIRLSLELSDSYDESMLTAARNSFASFLSATAIARWMRLAYPEKAAEWETEATWQLGELRRNVYHRRRPRRRISSTTE